MDVSDLDLGWWWCPLFNGTNLGRASGLSSIARRLVGLALVLLGLSGCGARPEPVVPVRGQVRLDGRPLAEATIVFHRRDKEGRNLTGRSLADGTFRMTTHASGDGVPPGRYGVTVEWRELVKEGDESSRIGRNLLPARYADPTTSGLECEIVEGDNDLPPWDLSSR